MTQRRALDKAERGSRDRTIMVSAHLPLTFGVRWNMVAILRRACLVSTVILSTIGPRVLASPIPTVPVATSTTVTGARFANFGAAKPSVDARYVANWIADSRDNTDADFVIVDKKFARIYVFDREARLQGSSPVLLGAARGDDAVPGIGTRPIEQVLPEERTTHAGRFVGERGRNTQGEDIVWVDYDAAVSIHRVRATKPAERRLERLATPTVDDNRISYGCINVPVAFYESHIRPVFATRNAVIYVLPEVKSALQVFGSYDVASAPRVARSQP